MAGLVVITGGARAGKTAFALALARDYPGPVTYLATAEAGDDEMAARIAHHRGERPAAWRTLEAALDPVAALRAGDVRGLVLFDCLTLWTSNLLLRALPAPESHPARGAHGDSDEEWRGQTLDAAVGEAALGTVLDAVRGLLAWQRDSGAALIVVTNEVGLGIVPAVPLARLYRDALGRANQIVAAGAERVYLVVAGLALEMRGAGAVPVAPTVDSGFGPFQG